jgi:hypothetical protein
MFKDDPQCSMLVAGPEPGFRSSRVVIHRNCGDLISELGFVTAVYETV